MHKLKKVIDLVTTELQSQKSQSHFIEQFEADLEQSVHRGEFGANMKVALINDGPLTIIIDTKKRE